MRHVRPCGAAHEKAGVRDGESGEGVGSGCSGSKGERRAVADGGEPGAEVIGVYGGELGFVGDQPRDPHDVGVVAGVVAEAAGGEDYAGERRSLRVEAGFEYGGVLVGESLAVLAPETRGLTRRMASLKKGGATTAPLDRACSCVTLASLRDGSREHVSRCSVSALAGFRRDSR